MTALVDPRHGSVHDIAAALFPRLSPIMLGTAVVTGGSGGRKGTADATAVRTAACTFVCDVLRWALGGGAGLNVQGMGLGVIVWHALGHLWQGSSCAHQP